jgi:hypothetical protein
MFCFSEGAQGFSPAKIQRMEGALAPGLLTLVMERFFAAPPQPLRESFRSQKIFRQTESPKRVMQLPSEFS